MLVTMPEAMPTVTDPGQLQLQVPPPVAWLRVVVPPSHMLSTPVAAGGAAVTVTTDVVKQPVPTV